MGEIIDGRKVSEDTRKIIGENVAKLKSDTGVVPGLDTRAADTQKFKMAAEGGDDIYPDGPSIAITMRRSM